MKNKIEIQILTPATRQQLIELRDAIRGIEGMEGFDLLIPPMATKEGQMGTEIMKEAAMAVIMGVGHFATEIVVEHLAEIGGFLNKIFKKGEKQHKVLSAGEESMGNSKEWEAIITTEQNNIKSNIFIDSEGARRNFSNIEYSINPDKTYALLIGVSKYDDSVSFSPIPPVEGNLNDMYKILVDKRLMGLPQNNIRKLEQEDTTSLKIRLAIADICKKQDAETLILYFAGHGQNMGNNKLSLIVKDTCNIDDELLYDVPYSFVEQKIKSSPAAQKIVFIDACHSGLATQGNNNSFDFENVTGTFTLASTSADQSSYYKKENNNTHFTSFLTEAFNKGISNTNSMLSLNDLYNYTKQRLIENKLPAPTCKIELENVIADKFYISSNPSFSLDERLKRPKQLYDNGKYEEARRDYLLLLKTYSDNSQLSKEYLEFEKNVLFSSLVTEGDKLFYEIKNYTAAENKYREAFNIRNDESIKNKIIDCKKKQTSGEVTTASAIAPTTIAPIESDTVGISHEKTKKNVSRIKLYFSVLVIIGAVVYLSIKFFSNTDTEAENKPPSTASQQANDSTQEKADSTNKSAESLIKAEPDKPLNENSEKDAGKTNNQQKTETKPTTTDLLQNKIENTERSLQDNLNSDLQFLNGVTYEASSSTNTISFTSVGAKTIIYSGSISDFTVAGKFILSNKKLKAVSGDLEGILILSSDNQLMAGNLKLKNKNIPPSNVILRKNKDLYKQVNVQ